MERKNFGAQTWLYPMPVLIIATYNDDGTADAMNAAWGGIHDTNQIAVCIAAEHKTAENLQKRKSFTVGIGDAAHLKECDYLGIVSGNQVPDKVARAGFHAVRSAFTDAPVLEELPMTLECRLISYDPATGCTVGQILNVSAPERVLGSDGKIDPAKLQAISFDPVHHKYLRLGEAAGQAFQAGTALK